MNITVIGLGHIGRPLAVLLSNHYRVFGIDITTKARKQTAEESLNKVITDVDFDRAVEMSHYVIITLPTNGTEYGLNTDVIEQTLYRIDKLNEDLDKIPGNQKPVVIIKSTVPIGFTDRMNERYHHSDIVFVPEFLREKTVYQDYMSPSRIIISNSKYNDEIKEILTSFVLEGFKDVMFVGTKEAEAIKLFSNTYLATRVAFFNELDSYCMKNNINTVDVIKGMSKDYRIGKYYNTPSFGFAGYCLPKDSKNLAIQIEDSGLDCSLIQSINDSNTTRIYRMIHTIHNMIKDSPDDLVCFYVNDDTGRLDVINQIYDCISRLHSNTIRCTIDDYTELEKAKLIVSNKMYPELKQYKEKVFTRDLTKN